MQFKARHTRIKIADKTIRMKRVFAWLPTYIAGIIVWLEMYEILQVYNISQQKVIIEEKEITFALGKWDNLSKRLCS